MLVYWLNIPAPVTLQMPNLFLSPDTIGADLSYKLCPDPIRSLLACDLGASEVTMMAAAPSMVIPPPQLDTVNRFPLTS